MEAGAVNSFMHLPDELLWICYMGFAAPSFEPMPLPSYIVAPQANLTLNYQVSPKHAVGMGYTRSEYGAKQGTEFLGQFGKRSIHYNGITMRHRYKLLNGNRVNLLLSNSINVEIPKKDSDFFQPKTGLGHTAALTFSMNLLHSFDFEITMIGKTALTEYVEGAWDGRYNRFGTGLLLGLSYRI